MHKTQMRSRAKKYKGKLKDAESIVVIRAIPVGGGKKIPVGTDVTQEAKGWRNARALLKDGYIFADPPVNHRALLRFTGPPGSGKKPASTDVTPTVLADLSQISTVAEIRTVLKDAGADIPSGLKKAELLEMVRELMIAHADGEEEDGEEDGDGDGDGEDDE